MSLFSEIDEIDGVVNRLLDCLATTISSKTGRTGVMLRYTIGDIRGNYEMMIVDGTFAAELQECFTAAYEGGATLLSLAYVREGLFAETPVGDISKAIVQMATLMCLSVESRLISAMIFVSRDDVQAMLAKVIPAFATARDIAADAEDSLSYQALTTLGGSLIDHLASVARPLPRMVNFKLNTTLPALTASMRLYYEADRWGELVDENRIIHPMFCLRDLRGLSA